jgi:ribosomal protein S18 acetylase RimI-like enzyme
MRYHIRALTSADQSFLWEMLYHSLYVPGGNAPFPRSILDQPDIAAYVKDWGRKNDSGFAAIDVNSRPLGAIWLRTLSGGEKGFGYIDDRTPELGMAVLPEYRGQGIGTSLLAALLTTAAASYECISLSVSPQNPALRLYHRAGFETVGSSGDSITMRKLFHSGPLNEP